MAVLVMWFTLLMFEKSMDAGWVFTFFTIFLLCLNIPITTDIILSVTPPNRRATAIAIQTLVAHLLGDAASPYMIGLLSDWFHSPTAIGPAAQSMDNFLALRNALFLPNLVLVMFFALLRSVFLKNLLSIF
jgi:hypothetical protein